MSPYTAKIFNHFLAVEVGEVAAVRFLPLRRRRGAVVDRQSLIEP
jgi:hypothetical protein